MKTAQKHVYIPDPSMPGDYLGRVVCTCGLARSNEVHQIPEQDEDTGAIERRRLGEKERD